MPAEVESLEPRRWGEGEIRGPVHLFRERLLLRLFCPLLPRGRVLDAGSGSGSLALALCRAGYQVEAVEFSAAFVRSVQEKVERGGMAQKLRVHRGSATALDFEDASFDGLVCGEVLEHIAPELGGDVAAVREFGRVLKPGAPCVASVPLNPALWDHSDEWAGHVKRYEREEFVELFEGRGFVVEKVRVWGFPLGRLYHALLFGPWLKRSRGREGRRDAGARVAANPLLVELAAGLLRFDQLFARWPWGRGVVLCARRAS